MMPAPYSLTDSLSKPEEKKFTDTVYVVDDFPKPENRKPKMHGTTFMFFDGDPYFWRRISQRKKVNNADNMYCYLTVDYGISGDLDAGFAAVKDFVASRVHSRQEVSLQGPPPGQRCLEIKEEQVHQLMLLFFMDPSTASAKSVSSSAPSEIDLPLPPPKESTLMKLCLLQLYWPQQTPQYDALQELKDNYPDFSFETTGEVGGLSISRNQERPPISDSVRDDNRPGLK